MIKGNKRRKRHQKLKRDRDRLQEKEKIVVRKAYNTTDRQTDRHMILLTAMALVSVAG